MKPLTTEQHLNNILFAIQKATMTGKEHDEVKASFNHLVNILIPKENAKG